jgi:tetratricopeptide (TPR) repeat protein
MKIEFSGQPNFIRAHAGLAEAYRGKGMYKEAIAEMRKAVELSGGSHPMVSSLGYTYAVAGKRDEAIKILNHLKAQSEREFVSPEEFALIYAALGEKNQAFAWLEKERHSYCIFLRPRHETTGKHAGQQGCDLAFSLAAVLRVVRRGIGLGPYTDAHGAGRVGPMSEPYLA